MLWFRFYHEALDDLKVQQLPPATFKHWVNLLCLANLTTPRGTLPDMATTAYRLRVSESKARSLIDEFMRRGLIDREGETLRPHGWELRQKRSDNVADRVAKHRSNVTDPLQVTGADDDGNVLDKEKSREELEQSRAEDPPTPPKGESPVEPPKVVKPLPEHGEAQKIVAAYCREAKLDQPADYKKSVGIAERMARAGVKAGDIPDLFLFVSQWSNGPDLTILMGSIDKWRAGKNLPARASPIGKPTRGMSNDQIADYVNGGQREQDRDREDAYDTTGRVVERRDHAGENRGLSLAS